MMHNYPEFCFADDLERNAKWHCNHPAIIAGEEQLTHGELLEAGKQLGAALFDAGVRNQDRVGILAMNSMEFVKVIAACQWSGYIMSTVNFRLAAAEMLWIINDSAPKVLIFEAQYLPVIESLRDELPTVKTFVCIGAETDWAISFDDFIAAGDPAGPPCRACEADPFCLIYTSGTTGRPKGCLWGQRELRQLAHLDANYSRLEQPDRLLIVMPLFHIGGLILTLCEHVMGGTVYLHRQFDAKQVLEAIERDKLTVLLLAPTMVQLLLDEPGLEKADLSSVRTLLYSAAPMPSTVLAKAIDVFKGCSFVNLFGQTEITCAGLSSMQHLPFGTEEERKRLLSIGQPYPNMEMKIIDDDGNECPDGVAGELLARGVSMFRGYWNNSIASAETLRNRWVHTGDMARIENGFVYLVDRKKDVIISGGENIYSREVEEAILKHEAVSECAVIGIPDITWGENVCAVITLKRGCSVTEVEIIEHSRSLIASYKKPKKVIITDAIPKMVTGKVDKKTLRAKHTQS